jgi:hypothetical protein
MVGWIISLILIITLKTPNSYATRTLENDLVWK